MTLKKQGFCQALGVFAYCLLVGLFIGNANNIVGNLGLPFGPVLVLLLFSASVLVCATLVFYKPYKFFIEGKKKEALSIVISTAVWLFVFVVLFFSAVFIFK
jgi:uncharacterized membrane protein YidH (DUF202 family)